MNRKLAWIGIALLAANGLIWARTSRPQKQEIDTQGSTLTVKVGKTGFFSAFGHTHEISAPMTEGLVDASEHPSVSIRVDPRNMRVLDADVSEMDRNEIQKTMLGPQVLDGDRYQEIVFRSTGVNSNGAGAWTVHGLLTLHGQSHPVDVAVTYSGGRYKGHAEVKQTQFGIQPVRAAGGAIKVLDEVTIEFNIRVAQ
jgi:polyisoprenoid-binding protein YceI